MFKKLLKNKKAQQTAEYALLISLVVAAVIAMQTYAQRAISGRIRDAASVYMVNGTSELGNTQQYTPYYASSEYELERDSEEIIQQDTTTISKTTNELRTRSNGITETTGVNGFAD